MSDETKGYFWGMVLVLVVLLVGAVIIYAVGASDVSDLWCRSLGYDSGDWTYIEKTRCVTISIEELYP